MKLSDKQQVARIERIMVPWLRRLDLFNTWDITVTLVDEACCGKCEDPDDTFAMITIGTPYKRACIEVNRSKLEAASLDGVELMLLHELVHILIQPLMSECATLHHQHDKKGAAIQAPPPPRLQQALETVTDTFTNLLLWDAKGKRQHGTTSSRS